MTVTSRGAEMICIVSVLVGLSLISVILRVFARMKRSIGLGMDDYLCFLSLTLLIAMLIELVLCKHTGIHCPKRVTDRHIKGSLSEAMDPIWQT